MGEVPPQREWTYVPEGTWARSWFFVRRVWVLFANDRSLITVAAVATLLNVVSGVVVFGGAAVLLGGLSDRLLLGITGAVLALPTTVVSTFCNVALLRMAEARFEGRRCTARQGFAAARRRLPAILGWSLLAVGVGAVLDELAERVPIAGPALRSVLGFAWSLATMFAVPVLAVEDAGARRAVTRSAEIFRARWGEGLTGSISVAAVTGVAAVPGVALVFGGLAVGGPTGVILVVCGAALLMVALTVSNALNELFALALYRDEVRHEASFGLRGDALGAFVVTKARKRR